MAFRRRNQGPRRERPGRTTSCSPQTPSPDRKSLGISLSVLKWVIVTLLPAGRLADVWGRKRVTVVGAVISALRGAEGPVAGVSRTASTG